MQYFRYPILPKSFLLVVGFSLRREDYQSWMFVNVPIASSATPRQEKKYSHARIYSIA
ncbi:BFH_collapsed_G0053450.mRNA.1.CDS.1 [Saccharomyces cerevisiae]|nr:BGP_1a_G0052670.mRNA.1.CDS.1 [Saccharomyces cerevisiae]CAI5318290.1 BFH_HP2_G0043070.mRNA.1.CDS.1 [Saccharomyces cerevisiae]CAI6714689.1 BFH_HP2_G0043070.mRNA.1.CDS.1 [Saccharomyces cerevisiae]CAI6814355.1 BFH_HP1_G0053210.mRNA.1.CDS.1 [Saccharomyces cerevisiae]CAI7330195.1 BGP_1a_G0052670.mRNA.1.CDS.1 [Saccharomyces cerevisiae]